MGAFIIKFDTRRGPRYLEYSTVCDAPITYGMTLTAFKKHYLKQYGATSQSDMEGRLARTEATGTSSRIHASVADVIKMNRAGKDATRLTVDQIIDYYVIRQGKGAWPTGTKH